jgi:hypothetical protein
MVAAFYVSQGLKLDGCCSQMAAAFIAMHMSLELTLHICMLQKINSSTMLEEEDVDIVNFNDVRLLRYLGNGAFGTVREGYLHHTPVAVKILKEGEVGGALGSLAMASSNKDLQGIRKHLVQVCCCCAHYITVRQGTSCTRRCPCPCNSSIVQITSSFYMLCSCSLLINLSFLSVNMPKIHLASTRRGISQCWVWKNVQPMFQPLALARSIVHLQLFTVAVGLLCLRYRPSHCIGPLNNTLEP